jgi:hypothetical protein
VVSSTFLTARRKPASLRSDDRSGKTPEADRYTGGRMGLPFTALPGTRFNGKLSRLPGVKLLTVRE